MSWSLACQKFGLCQTQSIKYLGFYPNKLYPAHNINAKITYHHFESNILMMPSLFMLNLVEVSLMLQQYLLLSSSQLVTFDIVSVSHSYKLGFTTLKV